MEQQQNSFIIYNASAGSGKTYTLVKTYLKVLLQSNYLDKFKRILAITFTNKAVAEMKERILKNLKEFASESMLSKPSLLFQDIAEELDLDYERLHKKSAFIHDAILNNYAAFDVVTIDTFTHRIIRTFAHDLKLPQNFEVVLDTDEILQEAVHNLIAKIGQEEELTALLVDYALQKTDDDKSWDIALDLMKTAKLLLNENEREHVLKLQEKSINDFKGLEKLIQEKIVDMEVQLKSCAQEILDYFQSQGIDKSCFLRGSLFTYFTKIAAGDFGQKYDAAWQQNLIDGKPVYPKKIDTSLASLLDSMQQRLIADFELTRQGVRQHMFLKDFKKSIVPLAVLSAVHKEIALIKEDQNVLLISEFNQIIAEEIKNQPAPFIYERIGERYQNYFIDEFQDTSMMQWQNLVPLAENALVSDPVQGEAHSLMLVGDAKQSIYRWRGGKPEQFIGLCEEERPFYVDQNVVQLETNYRSYSEVIHFNNDFFTYVSEAFTAQGHGQLYVEGNQQKENAKQGGYVNISFVEEDREAQKTLYQERVLEVIHEVIESGFSVKDICIITRTNSNGIAIADFLVEHDIDIVSSETLLLNKSATVRFIVAMLYGVLEPENKNYRIEILYQLYGRFQPSVDEHTFYTSLLSLEIHAFFEKLNEDLVLDFKSDLVHTLPLYELVEELIRCFKLVAESDAYVQYFLDEILRFTQNHLTGLHGFLEYWEQKKDKLSIVASGGVDAVTIMSIHKSKGLEFPVVIYPFADLDIYKEREPKMWLPIDEETYGVPEAYISARKESEHYTAVAQEMMWHRRTELELDNINLLYVVLTRAKEQLYVISKKSVAKNGEGKADNFAGYFINYLQKEGVWNEEQLVYEFGDRARLSEAEPLEKSQQLNYISSSRDSHELAVLTKSGYLWDTHQESAIEKGNLIHLILSKINYKHEIEEAFHELVLEGVINELQAEELQPIISDVVHASGLSQYFELDYEVFNERPILTRSGAVLIPDRLVFKGIDAVIIDYKTGEYDVKHEEQLERYSDALIAMKYNVSKKILVYLNDTIALKEV